LGQPPLGLENLSLKSKFFNFFSLVKKITLDCVKAKSASYLMRVKHMLGSGQVLGEAVAWEGFVFFPSQKMPAILIFLQNVFNFNSMIFLTISLWQH